MPPLTIVADENIPQVANAFEGIATIRLVNGRGLRREALEGADALLVRSVTRVDGHLLAGSSIQFVGTATIGTDHVDRAYLASSGIGFASAKGSNANSVAEYVVAALLEIAAHTGTELGGRTLGIVGRGNIGSRVAKYAPLLGLRVLMSDPPLERAGECGPWTPLPSLLRESDFVTFHVPLNRDGADRTLHLIGGGELAVLKPGAWLINTSRGPVVDNAALLGALEGGHLGGAVLDVWEGEPDIMRPLLERCLIGTPHIAGYSIDGKLNGTRMMHAAVLRHFGLEGAWEPETPPVPRPAVAAEGTDSLRSAVRHA
jgi:erythronate-4-phosphate dehydrogenase